MAKVINVKIAEKYSNGLISDYKATNSGSLRTHKRSIHEVLKYHVLNVNIKHLIRELY